MSACPTCKSLQTQMPSRVIVLVDGVTYVQSVGADSRLNDLQAACNYLLGLIDKERANAVGATHG